MKTLTAFYDLAFGPVSYDVIGFLLQADAARHDQGCERLHVVIVPAAKGVDGVFRDKLNLYDAGEMHWRLWNIVIPACRLVGATVTLATDWQQAERLAGVDVWPPDWRHQSFKNRRHMTREIIERVRQGGNFTLLQAMGHARKKVREFIAIDGRPLVTITTRNTYEPGRNSDPVLWAGIAKELSDDFQVVELCDTDVALSRGFGYGELNIDLRLALYQEAVLNIQPHGGTSVLCWFSGAPFLMFGAAQPANYWAAGWPSGTGLQIGEQLPWARPDQRLIYAIPSEENVRQELENWRLYRSKRSAN